MLPQGTLLSLAARTFCLISLLLLSSSIQSSYGNKGKYGDASLPDGGRIFARVEGRESISLKRLRLLETKLRQITGFPELNFESDGLLRLNIVSASSGSKSARVLLEKALRGSNIIVIEDTSRRADVVFARVVTPRQKLQKTPVYLVQIDFVDFEFLIGDQLALKAFDVGWAFLHELDHVVESSADSSLPDEVGDCEAHINTMREECNLPLRTQYFHTHLPRSVETLFISRFVRLPFVQRSANKQKRYWVMWDAGVVGRLEKHRPTLSLTSP